MSDIAASEQRLIAALDRIDRSLDAGAARRTDAAPDDGVPRAAQEQIETLRAELSALHALRAADLTQMEAMLTTIEGLLVKDGTGPDDDLPAPAGSEADDPAGAAGAAVYSEAEGR